MTSMKDGDEHYATNTTYAICLLIITAILQACAIATLIIRWRTRAPDILGYISTMTRDNIYTSVPDGGNTLSGIERARRFANMRVQLIDVRPEQSVGHIALSSVTTEKASAESRLDKKKPYA